MANTSKKKAQTNNEDTIVVTANKKKGDASPSSDERQISARIYQRPSVIVSLILGAVGVFFVFCLLLTDKVGVVGQFFGDSLRGLFGSGAAFVPLFMILTAILRHTRTEDAGPIPKIIFSAICVLFISVLCYDISDIPDQLESGEAAFGIRMLWEKGTSGVGGGVIGGLLGQGLNICIGIVGTIIVAILVIIIFVVFYLGIDVAGIFRLIMIRIGDARASSKARRANQRLEAKRLAEERAAAEKARRAEEERAAAEARAARPSRTAASLDITAETDDGFEDAIVDYGVAAEAPRRNALPEITYGPASGVNKGRKKAGLFDAEAEEGEQTAIHDSDLITATEAKSQVIHPVNGSNPALYDIDEDAGEVAVSAEDQIIESLSEEYLEEDLLTGPKNYSDFEKITSTESGESAEGAVAAAAVTSAAKSTAATAVQPAKAASDTVDDPISAHKAVILPEMIIDRSSVAKNAKEMAPIESDEESIEEAPTVPDRPKYQFPPYSLLKSASGNTDADMNAEIQANADKLIETLASFNVRARISSIARGPRITRYELVPDAGIRIRSIANLVDDISMNLASAGIRIEAPIPGKAAVGIEVPNRKSSVVCLRDLLDTDAYRSIPSKTCVCLGSDVAGDPVFCDIAKMPHMLVAGATGMGKSVCINVIITSILYKADPNEVKLILIDPKKVEFGIYGGIPHLLVPVVSDPQKAAGALSWAVGEMERRFDIFEDLGVRDIKGYKKLCAAGGNYETLPSIIIIIDELHDLMMVSPDSVEKSIVRIAQKARAAGIHLILGTQRPSVDVITGVIKANVPSRIAFRVASQVDSRTILDMVGAEKLLNNGDMLYMAVSESKAKRVQGAFVDEDEVSAVTAFLKEQGCANIYNEEVMKDIEREAEKCDAGNKKGSSSDSSGDGGGEDLISDPKFRAAIELSIEFQKISTSLLQRKLGIGYGKAAKFIDQMHEMGIVSAPDGQKPRNVLITYDQYLEMMAKYGD